VRRCLGGEWGLGEAFQPQLIVPHIPAQCAICCSASAETLIVAEPEVRGKTDAGTTNDGLVGEERRGTLREAGNEDLSIKVPSFHP